MTTPALPAAPPIAPLPAAADPLAGLRDWHLPGPVAWWPPAPGWWLVAGFVLIGVAVGWTWRHRRRRRRAAARIAVDRLAELHRALQSGGDQRRFVAAVSQLLRRLALIRYPRERVAGLTGTAWLNFLDATGGCSEFSQGPGQVLANLHYRPPAHAPDGGGPLSASVPGLDGAALAALAARWIRTHQETAP